MKLSDEQSLRMWCIEKAMSYPQLYKAGEAVEIAQKIYELIATGRIGELPRDGDGDKAIKREEEMSDER